MLTLVVRDKLEEEYQRILKQLKEGKSIKCYTTDELLFLRIRVGIVEGEIDNEKVEVKYEKEGQETFISRLDKEGNIPNWPTNVLNNSLKLAGRYLRRNVENRRKNGN